MMTLRQFQRRLADCPVHRGHSEEDGDLAAIILHEDMVDMGAVRLLAGAPGSATRIVPQGVLHAFALGELAERCVRYLTAGPDTEETAKQLAIARHVFTPEEWQVVEQLAAAKPLTI